MDVGHGLSNDVLWTHELVSSWRTLLSLQPQCGPSLPSFQEVLLMVWIAVQWPPICELSKASLNIHDNYDLLWLLGSGV